MPSTVTTRQQDIFSFLLSFAREKGYPPTIREIASHFHIISLNAVRVHLRALEKKGLISVEKGRSRGIHITDRTHEEIPLQGLPLLGRIAAGTPALAAEERGDTITLDCSFWSCGEPLFLLMVKGDSMEPELREGDLVVVKPQSHARQGDIVVALIDDEATVKTLHYRGHHPVLHPINPAYSIIEPGDNFSINGKVVGVIRKY